MGCAAAAVALLCSQARRHLMSPRMGSVHAGWQAAHKRRQGPELRGTRQYSEDRDSASSTCAGSADVDAAAAAAAAASHIAGAGADAGATMAITLRPARSLEAWEALLPQRTLPWQVPCCQSLGRVQKWSRACKLCCGRAAASADAAQAIRQNPAQLVDIALQIAWTWRHTCATGGQAHSCSADTLA